MTPRSPLARVVHEVWRGRPVTIVKAPPGSGKSELIADVCAHLHQRTDLRVAVATPTRDAAVTVAGRIAALLPDKAVRLMIGDWPQALMPDKVAARHEVAPSGLAQIQVGTLMSRAVSSNGKAAGDWRVDVLIVDEAYQGTFELVSAAAQLAEQVLLVGDPGQIGPVVSANVSPWRARSRAPHLRAPEVFATRADAATVHLERSYRLGAPTVGVLAPLYDFEFTSARPERAVEGLAEIETLQVSRCEDPYAFATAQFVARRAVSLIGRRLLFGPEQSRLVTARDVAVVVSHNAQNAAIEGCLAEEGVAGIQVGTADRLQGGQWHAVVALDPLVGKTGASGHALSAGRLCVEISRHMTHLTWVHDGAWEESLGTAGLGRDEVAAGRAVRRKLMALAGQSSASR